MIWTDEPLFESVKVGGGDARETLTTPQTVIAIVHRKSMVFFICTYYISFAEKSYTFFEIADMTESRFVKSEPLVITHSKYGFWG